MAHELIHIKRFDNLRKMIMQATLCIHWFNPMVWLMQRYFLRDIEVTCDERVLRLLGEEQKEAYAFTLIHFAEKSSYDFLVYSGFGKNVIQERIVSIMKFKKKNIAGVMLASGLIIASTAVFVQASVKDDAFTVTEVNENDDSEVATSDSAENTAISSEAVSSSEGESVDYSEAAASESENNSELASISETKFDQDAYYQEVKKNGPWFTKDNPEDYKKFQTYEPFGIKYDEKADEIYFQGHIVRELDDTVAGEYFARTQGIAYPADSIDVYAVYQKGQLTGLRIATKEEYEKRSEERRKIHEQSISDECDQYEENGPMDMSFFVNTTHYDEYKKFGLKYDEKKASVMYQGKVVGYFKDEYKKDTYTFFSNFNDTKAEIGVCTKRDEQYHLLGLEIVDLDKLREDADVWMEESNNYVNRFYEDIASSECDEPDDSTLEQYKDYGVTYDSKRNVWSYQKRDIAILIDSDEYKYLDETTLEHGGSYVYVKRDKNGKISDLEFIEEDKAIAELNK